MRRRLAKKRLAHVFSARSMLVGAAAVWMLWNPAAAGASVQKRVLLFYDAGASMQANAIVDQEIRSVLNAEFGIDLDVRSEYFEVSPLKKSDYPALSSWLRRKYRGMAFDVVVAVGGNALRFVREYNQEPFNGARIVFWGRRTALDSSGSSRPITGVVAPGRELHLKGNVQFIRTLQPDLERLIVVGGASENDREWEDAARQELRTFENRFTVTYLVGLSLDSVRKHVANLPKKTAILFLTINRDGAGRSLIKSEALTQVVTAAAAPVYSTSAIYMDTGMLGGALVSQVGMSRETGVLITRLLRGENIEELPVRDASLVPTVNWRQLKRWNIPEDRLPPGTVVMYQDQSLWTQYRWHIIGAAFVFTLEGALIVALLFHRANRRRAEKAMKESQRLLQSTIDALDARVALLDGEGTIIAVNTPWRKFAVARNDGAGNAVGNNYLTFFENSTCEESRVVSNGIRDLLSGQLRDFHSIYPCVQNNETSWFQVRINLLHSDGVRRFVVAHENVTEIKKAHDAQQQLADLLLRAQDDARRRIARDLHDVTVQDLAAIRADITRIQRLPQGADHSLQEILGESASICDRVIKDLRTVSYLLHPPLLDEAGLIPALKWFVRGFIQRSGVQVELLVMDDIGRLGTEVETALFRVVQESLTNIHRHSGSKSAVVWVTKEYGTVRVQITDEGHGFSMPAGPDDQEAAFSTGVGITGMRQRLIQLGGELEIESNSQGTTVSAKIEIPGGRYATYSVS